MEGGEDKNMIGSCDGGGGMGSVMALLLNRTQSETTRRRQAHLEERKLIKVL